jgi:hypothetical protein
MIERERERKRRVLEKGLVVGAGVVKDGKVVEGAPKAPVAARKRLGPRTKAQIHKN